MGEKKIFSVIDENQNKREAELITLYYSEQYNKRYAIYSLDDKNNIVICASSISKDSNNNDILIDLVNEEERQYVIGIVKNIILAGKQ